VFLHCKIPAKDSEDSDADLSEDSDVDLSNADLSNWEHLGKLDKTKKNTKKYYYSVILAAPSPHWKVARLYIVSVF
jgi:hypothetical protein